MTRSISLRLFDKTDRLQLADQPTDPPEVGQTRIRV